MPSSPTPSGPPFPSTSVTAPFFASIPDDPATYDVLLARVHTIANIATPAWTTADINIKATMTIGDFDLSDLTRRQLTYISIAIHEARPPYPTVNLHRTTGGLTRLSLLQLFLDGEHEHILAFTARPPRPAITPTDTTPSPPPPPPPTPAPASAPSKTPPTRFAAPPPPNVAARAAASPAYPPSSAYKSGAVRAVAQYYTPDRQYGGLDDESLPRARATFSSVCDAFSVPPPFRAVCLPFALRLTEHDLPALVQDNRGLPENNLWDMFHSRTYSPARTLRVRELWQSTSYRT